VRVEKHGTTSEYSNYGCRCDACREANRAAHADYMKRHPKQVLLAREGNRVLYWSRRVDLAWERRDAEMLTEATRQLEWYKEKVRRLRDDED
jgi:hypothetical protein